MGFTKIRSAFLALVTIAIAAFAVGNSAFGQYPNPSPDRGYSQCVKRSALGDAYGEGALLVCEVRINRRLTKTCVVSTAGGVTCW